jgi:hypothetical protein
MIGVHVGLRITLSVFSPLLMFTESFAENQIIQRTEHHVNQYSKQGLRTLVMAKRVLSDEEFAVWLVAHNEAKAALEGRLSDRKGFEPSRSHWHRR